MLKFARSLPRPRSQPRCSFFVLAAIAVGAVLAGPAHARNSFGKENAEAVEPEHSRYLYPYEAIGRFNTGCTGALIGNRLVLTTAHCVIDPDTGMVRPNMSAFALHYFDGASTHTYRVKRAWVGTFQPAEKRIRDWAIVQLASSPDSRFRRLKFHAVDFAKVKFPLKVQLAAYNSHVDSGRGLSVATDCELMERVVKKDADDKDTQEGLILHKCSTSTGSSGAPIYNYVEGDAFIEALHVSERRNGRTASVRRDKYSSEWANIAIPVHEAAAIFAKLQRTADSGLRAPDIEDVFEVAIDTKADERRRRATADEDGVVWLVRQQFEVRTPQGRSSSIAMFRSGELVEHHHTRKTTCVIDFYASFHYLKKDTPLFITKMLTGTNTRVFYASSKRESPRAMITCTGGEKGMPTFDEVRAAFDGWIDVTDFSSLEANE